MDTNTALNNYMELLKSLRSKLDDFETHQEAADYVKLHRVDVTLFLNKKRDWSYSKCQKILQRLESKNDSDT